MTNTGTENAPADVSALDAKIIKQVEYYFGDFNLPRDKFLQGKVKEDDGWVTIETLLTFNRLKSLTTEENVVAEALKKSTNQLLEVSSDGKKIRRSPAKPLPDGDKERQKLDELTVYAKGFPPTTTIDELLEFFGQFGQCINVFMRRFPGNRKFKGSVFATFATKAEAEAFIAKEGLKFNELELKRSMKVDYVARKKEERQARLEEKAKKKAANQGSGADASEEAEAEDVVLGCLLRVTGLGDKTTRETLKQAVEPYATLAFVDYSRGNPDAILRFVEEGSAQAVLAKLEAQGEGLKVDGCDVTATAVEGDEELEYWKKLAAAKRDKKNRFKRGQRGNRSNQERGRGHGGKQGGKKGGQDERNKGQKRPAEGGETAGDDGAANDEAKRPKTEDSGEAAE
uniref:HTH La-type RNA-binding domain-containing protein n=1 Tax=Amblyomma maculatum TaxID=34609 RepID=G3ML08_AMBMU